jgi:hypothetical protein
MSEAKTHRSWTGHNTGLRREPGRAESDRTASYPLDESDLRSYRTLLVIGPSATCLFVVANS